MSDKKTIDESAIPSVEDQKEREERIKEAMGVYGE